MSPVCNEFFDEQDTNTKIQAQELYVHTWMY